MLTTLPVIPYPMIDPVLIQVGPFAVRWYALAYIVGLLVGWRYCVALARKPGALVSPPVLDDFLLWVTLGVVFGGRLGYVLFYQPSHYLSNPLEIVMMWHGGMSFHGGLLGVVVAILAFAWRRHLPALVLSDSIAGAVPIGLFFGRLANFINGELYGRPSDVPWAMVFPHDRLQLPRHPSQLYEALLEGVALFLVLRVLEVRGARARPGLVTGAFLVGYGLARIIGEMFREPDSFLGFFALGTTMGQWLSLPLVLLGLVLVWRARAPARA